MRQAKIVYIVKENIINNWESKDEPEHLKTIRDRLLRKQQRAGRLLGLYQQIIQQGSIDADYSVEQIDLLLSGLVVKKEGKLKIYNRIYKSVFNLNWLEKELAKRRPYSENIRAWIVSDCQDESRLLRGKALEYAQSWAVGKSLSDQDYQFMAASLELNNREVQTALDASKKANQILEEAQIKAKKTIFRGLIGLSTVSLISIALLGIAANLSMGANKQKRQVSVNEIKALTISSEALFEAKQEFDALLEGLKAASKLHKIKANSDLENEVETALQQAIYWVKESNRLQGHDDSVLNVSFSADGNLIASASRDGTVKIWNRQGKELQTLRGHQDAVWSVNFSANGELITTASEDKNVKLWRRNQEGEFQLDKTLIGHQSWVVNAVFCSNDNTIITASWDGTIKIWSEEGKEIQSFQSHQGGVFGISVSPDEQLFATAGQDGTV
ncbi:MAG: WD40 repeat domain-containing protein, partial [Moorea sp. SIO2B7]|nr:WD40 repeat domain-containing protein [Moorena sp. SIO2B7]